MMINGDANQMETVTPYSDIIEIKEGVTINSGHPHVLRENATISSSNYTSNLNSLHVHNQASFSQNSQKGVYGTSLSSKQRLLSQDDLSKNHFKQP